MNSKSSLIDRLGISPPLNLKSSVPTRPSFKKTHDFAVQEEDKKFDRPLQRPSFPRLESVLTGNDDSVDDEEENVELLKILEKLKNAKEAISINRDKKRKREMMEEKFEKYNKETKVLTAKFAKRCKDSREKVLADGQQLIEKLASIIQDLEQKIAESEKKYQRRVETFANVEDRVRAFDERLEASEQQLTRTISDELYAMRADIEDELSNIHSNIAKATTKKSKENQVTRLLETFIASLRE